MRYRRRQTPLHAARAAAGALYCLALAVAALLYENPIVLMAVILALVGAGCAAQAGPTMGRTLLLGLPLALVIALVNALVSRDGLTVIVRLGDLPLLGHTDITLEATVYGLILGLRAIALLLCGALYTVAVDPDEMLGLLRRVSPRSALTATIATRMVPVLLRDSRRLADAQRCRPGPPPGRTTLLRAASAGVFERALDVAAALEVRGYGLVRRPPAAGRRPVSRHDLAFTAAAGAVAGLAITARVAGWAPTATYPSLHVAAGASVLAVAGGLFALALLPFADWRGVAR
jgi:energy-coupling factor transport system permease protein